MVNAFNKVLGEKEKKKNPKIAAHATNLTICYALRGKVKRKESKYGKVNIYFRFCHLRVLENHIILTKAVFVK